MFWTPGSSWLIRTYTLSSSYYQTRHFISNVHIGMWVFRDSGIFGFIWAHLHCSIWYKDRSKLLNTIPVSLDLLNGFIASFQCCHDNHNMFDVFQYSVRFMTLTFTLQILDEADLDDDGKLSYTEFEHVIERAPDFLRWVSSRCNSTN